MTETALASPPKSTSADAFTWACPACSGPLTMGSTQAVCERGAHTFPLSDGIWRFLPQSRADLYAAFLRQYATVRADEGWGRSDARYYRSLPNVSHDDPNRQIWRQRARSFHLLLDRVVAPRETESGRPLKVLDVGAGNCWLAHRLTERGHQVAAVDVSEDSLDGLGAHVWYAADTAPTLLTFIPVQAEFDHLPFAGEQMDLVIFNAALHYTTDYATTLREALRVLRPDGCLVIMDSPVYRDAAAGLAMVQERAARFQQRYGFPSNTDASEHYLTDDRLHTLAAALDVHWEILTPRVGVSERARRCVARLRSGRELARMPVIVGRDRAMHDVGAEVDEEHSPGAPAHLVGTRRPPKGPEAGGDARAPATAPDPNRRSRTVGFANTVTRGRALPAHSPTVRAMWRLLLRWRFRLFQRHRYNRLTLERVAGRPILVLPQVFNPRLLRSGEFLAQALNPQLIRPGATVLDLGTGSGIGAIVAGQWAQRVVAVDVNPEAVRCAQINVLLHHLEDRIDVGLGDLFAPVSEETFDVVLFNPPYYRGTPRDLLDHAWRSTDVVERFAAALPRHLAPAGSALVVLSTDGETDAFLQAFQENGLAVSTVATRDLINETLVLLRLAPSTGGA